MENMGYKWSFSLIIFIVLLATAFGCSKDNPVNVLPDEVAGTYDFNRYEFVPTASAIDPANVLDTLVVENSFLRLTSGGQFLLNYQFVNGPESLISGNFSISANRVELQAAAGSESRLTALLLESPIRLNRVSVSNQTRDGLEMENSQTVDLSNFSNRYEGLPPVPGTLFLSLTPRN